MSLATFPSTWEEAFENHPISSVRSLEKQLRASALRDREKLRGLVGNNYRDLLATAEQIVDLDDQTRKAESSISRLSQSCKPLDQDVADRHVSSATAVSGQIRLLDRMLRCAAGAIKVKSVMLASRLVVSSRLLLKSLESSSPEVRLLQWLNGRAKRLRQQLLTMIDVLLMRPDTATFGLRQATVAYCLSTSSSLSDAIKHLEALRERKLSSITGSTSDSSTDRAFLKQKCQYLIASVAAIKALSGRPLGEMLIDIQRQPLLQDPELNSLETLQLDLYRQLLPEEIVSFIPYLKHTAPSPSDTRSSLNAWTEKCLDSILSEIKRTIAGTNLPGTLRIRHDVFNVLLPSCFTAYLQKSGIDKIRDVFSTKVLELLEQRANQLQTLGQVLSVNDSPETTVSFWKSDGVQQKTERLDHGRVRDLKCAHIGVAKQLETTFKRIQKWRHMCDLTRAELNALAKVRWQDKVEEADDDDEDEAETIVKGLSKDDPKKYQDRFGTALKSVAEDLVQKLSHKAMQVGTSSGAENGTSEITALLRAIREFESVLHDMLSSNTLTALRESIASLQQRLAAQVTAELFQVVEVGDSAADEFTTDDLPSPKTVFVLQKLCDIMLQRGGIDLWTRPTVETIHTEMLGRITDADKKVFYLRNEFDQAYLVAAFCGEQDSSSPVVRKAVGYWGRTKLLFGALSGL